MQPAPQIRRHDLDWLRVLLFGLLVLHHAAVGFAPFGAEIYGFANDALGGPLVSLGIYWSHSWRLPSLFLISGIGTWFALRSGAGPRVLGARVVRLMVPALFGTFVLNAAAAYLIARIAGDPPGFTADPLSWWLAPEPRQVMHLWFLYNLTLYTLVCWPLFLMRRRLEDWSIGAPALLIAVAAAVTLVAVAAKPHGAAIAGDGYQLPWYLGFFLGGYLIGARHATVLDWARRRVWWLLGLGVLLFAAEVALLGAALGQSEAVGQALAAGGWAAAGLAPAYGLREVSFAAVEGANAWAWCLAALGLAAT
jgi:peptidoglycan/LPS O-acetylase OafA/YrhL